MPFCVSFSCIYPATNELACINFPSLDPYNGLMLNERNTFDTYPYNGLMLHGKNAIENTNWEAEGDNLRLSLSW